MILFYIDRVLNFSCFCHSLWNEQDGSMWLFTTQKFEGHRPFTVQANYEGFAEGMKLVLRVKLALCMKNE